MREGKDISVVIAVLIVFRPYFIWESRNLYLNQPRLFTKFDLFQNYIQVKGFHQWFLTIIKVEFYRIFVRFSTDFVD